MHNKTTKISRRNFLRSSLITGASLLVSACSSAKDSEDNLPVEEKPTVTAIVETVPESEQNDSENSDNGQGLIWYVDIEHENAVNDPNRKDNFDYVRRQRTQICGLAAGLPAESIHYWEVNSALAEGKNVRAICISGNTTDWWEYDFAKFEPLLDIIKNQRMPTLGLCGGHQLIALLFGGTCDAVRLLHADEEDLDPSWATGYYKEIGYMPVEIIQADPIFKDCGTPPVFFESHYWEVKELPAEFTSLARTAEVEVQVLKHNSLPIYGTQFHPEVYDLKNPDGATLLKNFFSLTLSDSDM